MSRVNSLMLCPDDSRELACVQQFHDKFGLPIAARPSNLSNEMAEFRIKFMQEELDEYKEAVEEGDLEKQFDALIDLAYVLLGTVDLQGFSDIWMKGFLEVQRANMSKERATCASQSKRGTSFDVVKPEGWVGPNLKQFL